MCDIEIHFEPVAAEMICVDELSIAAVIIYHRFSGLKQHKFVIL